MPKRNRKEGAIPPRKSARLEAISRTTALSIPDKKQHGRRTKTPRALPSPSRSSSIKRHYRPTLPKGDSTKPSNGTNKQSFLAKPQTDPLNPVASRESNYENFPPQSLNRLRECDPAEPISSNRSLLETIPKASATIKPTSIPSEQELGIREDETESDVDPIEYWATHNDWPDSFKDSKPMASLGKRQRTSDLRSGEDEKTRSYTQSRRDGDVPEQYSAGYQTLILAKGLVMDIMKGEKSLSKQSMEQCNTILRIKRHTLKYSTLSKGEIREIINDMAARNEAAVLRNVTPMIIPPITNLYRGGEIHLEHVVEESNANWYEQCMLIGPRIRPNIAIGLSSSIFTEGEVDKLNRYKSVYNWTQFTDNLYFPFLMCEVKCGGESLDIADRQNMHSCSVAVRAVLRIEEEADKYRTTPMLEQLSGTVVVFSISHDSKRIHFYGHYAIVRNDIWTYYRYQIDTYDILAGPNDLLILDNAVQNILKDFLPVHVKRLKDAISALPEPSALSVFTSSMSLNEDRQNTPTRDEDGFLKPAAPERSRGRQPAKGEPIEAKLLKQVSNLMEQLAEERKRNEEERKEERKRNEEERKEKRNQMEKQIQESRERVKVMEQQREEQMKAAEELRKELISLLKSGR